MKGIFWALLLTQGCPLTVGESPNVAKKLQELQDRLGKEAEDDKNAHDKIGCWCETYKKEWQESVSDLSSRIDSLEHDIKATEAATTQASLELEDHKKEFEDGQQDLAKASSIREKDADAFSSQEGEHVASISSLEDALAALSKSHGHEMVFMAEASIARIAKRHKSAAVFLQKLGGLRSEQSPDVVQGILKQMKSTFTENLDQMRQDEEKDQATFDSIKAAKSTELGALKKQMLRKQQEEAQGKMTIANKNKEKATAEKVLEESRELVYQINGLCDAEDKSFTDRTAERQAEIVALSSAQSEMAGAQFLSVSKRSVQPHFGIPMPGTAAGDMCEAAMEIVEEEWRAKAKNACETAKAGKSQEAADAASNLQSDIQAAQEKAKTEQNECAASVQEANDATAEAAKEASIEKDSAASDQGDAEANLDGFNQQSASCDKAVSELNEARSAQGAVLQQILTNNQFAAEVLQKAAKTAPQPAQAKLQEAGQHSEKVTASAKDSDAKEQDAVQKLIGVFQDTQRALSKAVIPLKMAKAEAEENVIAAKEEGESAVHLNKATCNPSALAEKVQKLAKYDSALGKAAESLAYDSLR